MTKKDLKAAMLSGDIESIVERLRSIPNLPTALLNIAEKLHRLYKLNKLDHDLRSLREVTAHTLQEVAELAARIEMGEVRLAETEDLVAQHERIIASINAYLAPAHVE